MKKLHFRKVLIAPYCDTSFSTSFGEWKKTWTEASLDASVEKPAYTGFQMLEIVEAAEC